MAAVELSESELSESELMAFLDDELGIDTAGIDAGTLLFSTGIIDSFSLVTLITFLEERLAFTMNPMDVTLDYLDSIERILGYLAKVRS